jgi:hypothetical protein
LLLGHEQHCIACNHRFLVFASRKQADRRWRTVSAVATFSSLAG